MSVILSKMEDAFESSGAKAETIKRYKELLKLHTELTEKLKKIKNFNEEALRGKTQEEVENGIQQFEKKLKQIEVQLEELHKSIGGGY